MPTTRIGLAGYGFGGRFFHAPLLAAAPSVEFAGVVTRSPERRAELAHDHPDMPAFDSLADLAAAGAVAVAISTPAPTHIPLALEAIELGLAVVADKPFALDAAQAHTAVEAAEQAGVVLSVYQNRRWDSDLLTVRRLLERGELGEVTLFESAFERYAADEPVPAAGGGILRDFGSHLVDQALFLFGPVASAYGEVRGAGELDERFFAVLEHRKRHDHPPQRRLGPGRARSALPRARQRGLLRRLRHGRSRGGADRGPLPCHRGRRVGHRAPRALGPPAARRRQRAGPERTRALGHLLPGLRRGRSR